MADHSNGIIPRSDDIAIMTTDIRQTLGLSNTVVNNRFGRLCVSDNVNKWSFYKPIFFKLNGSILTEPSDRGVVTGFCNVGSFENVTRYDYKKPDTNRRDVPYRLYDFVNYKHKATAARVTGSNTTVNPSSNVNLTLTYTTSEIPIHNLAGYGTYGSCNAICVIQKITGGTKVVAYRALSYEELTSSAVTTYTFSIPYTTGNYSQTTSIPLDYYVAFGNVDDLKPGATAGASFIVGDPNTSEVKGVVNVTVVIRGDLNNDLQWKKNNVNVELMNGLSGGGQLSYEAFQVFYESDCINSANNNVCYIRIKGLTGSYLSSVNRDIDIFYKHPTNYTWTRFITINGGVNNTNNGNWGYPWRDMAALRISGLPRAISEFRIYPAEL